MEQYSEAYIGLDVSKLRNAVAVADGGRGGEGRGWPSLHCSFDFSMSW